MGNRVLPLMLVCAGCIEDMGTNHQAVIGGTPSMNGSYPATGALIANIGGQRQPFCTGTLITPSAVLTAAHCLIAPDGIQDFIPEFTLALNANNVSGSQVIAGMQKVRHSLFNENGEPTGSLTREYDIGIVLLAQAVPGAMPAYLPTAAEVATLTNGMALEITGYGKTTASSEMIGIKYEAITKLVQLGAYELQVGAPGDAQNCNGDSGGPAYARVGNGLRIVGVVSRGMSGGEESCDRGGIDTRVDPYRNWISSYVTLPDPPSEPTPPPEMPPDDGSGSGSDEDPDSPDPGESGGCASTKGGSFLALVALIIAVLVSAARQRSAAAREQRHQR